MEQETGDELSFEDAIARLEETVARLEDGDMSIEEMVTRFEEGMALVRLCYRKLEAAQVRVERLAREDMPFPVSGDASSDGEARLLDR
ncbi:MAG: exodeoxyribonuclease VII small subunit [Chloroflexi bacterium]|nr:exodeoxyribonuclease VII small subunit [Chloroflexota bacterium]